jgi:hypothetical protein
MLKLTVYELPNRNVGNPNQLFITVAGYITFKGRNIFNDIDLNEINSFQVAYDKADKENPTTYLIPRKDDKGIPFSKGEIEILRVKTYLDGRNIKYPANINYEIIQIEGSEVIKLATSFKEEEDEDEIEGLEVDHNADSKRKYEKKTPPKKTETKTKTPPSKKATVPKKK